MREICIGVLVTLEIVAVSFFTMLIIIPLDLQFLVGLLLGMLVNYFNGRLMARLIIFMVQS